MRKFLEATFGFLKTQSSGKNLKRKGPQQFICGSKNKNLFLPNILCSGCYARLFGTAGYRGTQSNVWTDESEEFKTTSIKIKGKTPISGIPDVIGVTSEACIRCTDSVSIS